MYQPVRGTHDLLAEECAKQRRIVAIAKDVAALYGYSEIETPIFEFTGVFNSVGETSDIVTKETYTFTDRGGEQITLRPEATAPIMRAIVSNGLTHNTPLKLFYSGPMFRYERPQKGRYRQFSQIDVELVGAAQPFADAEIISMAAHILQSLNISANIVLQINTLGDHESRDSYRKVLVDYLSDFRQDLSEDSQKRLDKNPLRILDSKDQGDKNILENAPDYTEYLNAASADFFAAVLKDLDLLNIKYELNSKLVRGLDYYCHTAFEFITHDLGAQGTIIAGGRYDGLVNRMGGQDLPGVGWAGGIERLAMLSALQVTAPRPICVIPLGEAADSFAKTLANNLRMAGVPTDLGYSGNLGKRMKRADKANARHALIIGEEELQKEIALLRDLDSGEQSEIAFEAIIAEMLIRSKE